MGYVAYVSHYFGDVLVECERNTGWIGAVRYVLPKKGKMRQRVWIFPAECYTPILTISEHYFAKVSDTWGRRPTPPAPEGWETRWASWLQQEIGRRQSRITEDSSPRDAYQVLHLLPSAPEPVIKAAYRALAQIHHPDNGTDKDEEKMKDINEAYRVLIRK